MWRVAQVCGGQVIPGEKHHDSRTSNFRAAEKHDQLSFHDKRIGQFEPEKHMFQQLALDLTSSI